MLVFLRSNKSVYYRSQSRKFITIGNTCIGHPYGQRSRGDVDADTSRLTCQQIISRSRTIPDMVGAGLPCAESIFVSIRRSFVVKDQTAVAVFQQFSVSFGDLLNLVLHFRISFAGIDQQPLLFLEALIFQIHSCCRKLRDTGPVQGDLQAAGLIADLIVPGNICSPSHDHSAVGRDRSVFYRVEYETRIRIRRQDNFFEHMPAANAFIRPLFPAYRHFIYRFSQLNNLIIGFNAYGTLLDICRH